LNTQGIETLKAVARRSLWLILLLVAAGIVLMNVLRHSEGKEFEASSHVILSPADLSQVFSGSSAYVDPDLVDQTEKALARSPRLFADAAKRWSGTLGSGSDLRGATAVSKDGTTLTFTATSSDADRAESIANAVAAAYPKFRAAVASAAIDKTIVQIQAQLRASTGTTRADLLDQLNRLKVLKSLTSGNVLLVEPSRGAAQTRPAPIRDSVIGALIGFFIAMILVAIREAVDTRVRSEEEVEEALDVPVVGTVEVLPRRTGVITGGKQGERFGDMYALLAANVAQESGSRPTVIVVTSANAREGKTTTASNLAAALSRRNKDVVLVDLDTRKPALAKVFQIPQEAPGIEEVFRRKVNPGSLTWRVSLNGTVMSVAPSRLPRAKEGDGGNRKHAGILRVLPMRAPMRGGISGHTDSLKAILATIGQHNDYVVIDTPPALALPDVTELTKLVDMVIVVVRHGRASRRSLTALNRLHRGWADVKTNAVLVGVPRQDTYSYYEQ
jgi:Mrp family chromosome partitioning ATPase